MSRTKHKKIRSPAELAQGRYERKLSTILKKIASFERHHFIVQCLKRIYEIKQGKEIKFDFEHVWILAIKISAIKSSGKRQATKGEIVNVINKLWELHGCLTPYLSQDQNPFVAIRALASQQSTLQHNAMRSLADIARQAMLLSDKQEIDNYFIRRFGISIAVYCWVWTNILVQVSNSENGSAEISVPELILSTRAFVTPKELFLFFKAFSITIDELPSFFADFTAYDQDFESYFYDSPLKQKPFLYTGTALRTFSNNLTASAASFILPHVFKSSHDRSISSLFKLIFTTEFEVHIGKILSDTGHGYKNEENIKGMYRALGMSGNRNNVVDHMLVLSEHKKILLVESKGVEQTDFLKVILDPVRLASRLEGSHIKGIMQSQQCTQILSQDKDFEGFEFYSFIIVNDDYGFSDASSLRQMIGQENFTATKNIILDPSPIPLEQILFVRITTLEKICSSIQDGEYSLAKLLEESKRPELFNNLESIHHSLTSSHPASAIEKLITVDSPHVIKLINQKAAVARYTLQDLLQESSQVLSSMSLSKVMTVKQVL